MRIVGGDGDEFGALGGGIELRDDHGDEVEQARRVGRVDFVPGVGRLVIIGMQSGEKEKHRNFAGDKGSVVAGRVAAGGVFEVKRRIFLRGGEDGLKRRAGAHAADVDLLVLDAADHVHIEHGHGFVERARGLLRPMGRAEQAEFFAGEGHEENSAGKLALVRREQAREFEHAGGAGGIVVGAGMNLPDLRGRERIGIAVAEMIVVRADDDVFVGFAGEIGEDIVDGGVERIDVHVDAQVQRVGKGEGCGLGAGVDLASARRRAICPRRRTNLARLCF